MADTAKQIDWGGSAFPTEGGTDSGLYPDPGMSLRDYLAGQALAGICAGLCANGERGDRAYNLIGFRDAASDAYTLADAMIKARKAGEA